MKNHLLLLSIVLASSLSSISCMAPNTQNNKTSGPFGVPREKWSPEALSSLYKIRDFYIEVDKLIETEIGRSFDRNGKPLRYFAYLTHQQVEDLPRKQREEQAAKRMRIEAAKRKQAIQLARKQYEKNAREERKTEALVELEKKQNAVKRAISELNTSSPNSKRVKESNLKRAKTNEEKAQNKLQAIENSMENSIMISSDQSKKPAQQNNVQFNPIIQKKLYKKT